MHIRKKKGEKSTLCDQSESEQYAFRKQKERAWQLEPVLAGRRVEINVSLFLPGWKKMKVKVLFVQQKIVFFFPMHRAKRLKFYSDV